MSRLDKDYLSRDDYVLGVEELLPERSVSRFSVLSLPSGVFYRKRSRYNDRGGVDVFKLDYIAHQTDKHLLSIAPTRTGKGRCLILPNLLHLTDHSVVVIDPKGENALVSARYREKQGHKVIIFNPHKRHDKEFEDRGFTQFQNFNPLKNLDPTSDSFTDDIALIAEALIYDTGYGDSHWVDSAKGLIEFLITFLVTQEGETPTLQRLRSIVAGGHSVLTTEVLDKVTDSSHYLVYENVGRYLIANNEVHSIIATAETQTRILKSKKICSALEGDKFNFEEMKNKRISIYLILPSEYLVTHARYLRLVLLVAMSQFMRSEKGKHQVLIMLDEFANLGKLNIIENGYGLIAGHGITLWSFVQNLTQLQNLYPKNWETFIANSSVVTVSNVNDVTTAEYFSRRAGKQERRKTSVSDGNTKVYTGKSYIPVQETTNQSSNINSVWEDNLSVADIYNASPDSLFLFFSGRAMPIISEKLQYDVYERFSERADSNPMIKNGSTRNSE